VENLYIISYFTNFEKQVVQKLPLDARGVFEGSLEDREGGGQAMPCIASGYPVLANSARVEFAREGAVALREEWNRLIMTGKVAATDAASDGSEVQDVLRFVGAWAGAAGGTSSGGGGLGGGAGGALGGGSLGFAFH
jgi:intraflagellar transport protein 172